jgi:hypothetical protein
MSFQQLRMVNFLAAFVGSGVALLNTSPDSRLSDDAGKVFSPLYLSAHRAGAKHGGHLSQVGGVFDNYDYFGHGQLLNTCFVELC